MSLNRGIEGIMVAGGWLTVYQGGGPWLCVAVAAGVGALFGLLHGFRTVTLAPSQHVTGLGITLFASSPASYAYRTSLPKITSPQTIEPFADIAVPKGGAIDRVRPACGAQQPGVLRQQARIVFHSDTWN